MSNFVIQFLLQDLLRAGLPMAIEKALQGDERCVLDTMRLVDLLLVLLFEGRRALPKSCVSIPKGGIGSVRRFDSSNERSHRQLIDCIRSKDTDAVIDAIENGEYFFLPSLKSVKVIVFLIKLIDLKRNEERKNILQCTDVRHCRKSGTKNALPFNFDLISSFTYSHLQEPKAKLCFDFHQPNFRNMLMCHWSFTVVA